MNGEAIRKAKDELVNEINKSVSACEILTDDIDDFMIIAKVLKLLDVVIREFDTMEDRIKYLENKR